MQAQSIPRSKHFELQELADGVFAAIATDGGAAISNSGVIDLGDRVLVFDTFLTPQAALDLRVSIEQTRGQTPEIVINSHYHNDHIWGNQVFEPHSLILASTHTRQLITTEGLDEFRYYSANSAQRLAALQQDYQRADSEQQRTQLALWLGYYQGLVEALPSLSVCLPSLTFEHRLTLHGSKRSAELITFENVHSGSDTILYLPADGIVFASDLLFIGSHPYLGEGDPLLVLKTLKELAALSANVFVPGHGPVGTRDDLNLMSEYVEHCLTTAQRLATDGEGDTEKSAALDMPEIYKSWQLAQFYPGNIQRLMQRLSAAQ